MTWTNTMDLGGAISRQVAAGQMRAALIVSPQVEMPAGVDTECVNGTPPVSALAERYDLIALAKRVSTPVAIWLETSHADAVSYSSSSAFLEATRAPMAVDATVLQHASHRISLWQGLPKGPSLHCCKDAWRDGISRGKLGA